MYGCESWTIRRLSTEELMLLNCGVGEDFWVPWTARIWNQSVLRRSVLNRHWKDWCWNWSSNALATWCKEQTHWKDPDSGKEWGQEENWMTEDEMGGWHHWLDGHESEWTLGIDDGQGGLACAVHGVTRVGHNLRTTKFLLFINHPYSGTLL